MINDTASIIAMVSDHRIFCGIVGAGLDSEQLEFLPLIRDELIMVSAPKLALPEKIGPDQLTGLPFLFREKGSGTRECMENHFKATGNDPHALNNVAILGSNAAVKEAVLLSPPAKPTEPITTLQGYSASLTQVAWGPSSPSSSE
ncbi:MAG: hypothetical protein LC633_05725 [Desulfobulbaceae bacterium]|nr:hypothetical protein [Desulfobulbaceae bacterium]